MSDWVRRFLLHYGLTAGMNSLAASAGVALGLLALRLPGPDIWIESIALVLTAAAMGVGLTLQRTSRPSVPWTAATVIAVTVAYPLVRLISQMLHLWNPWIELWVSVCSLPILTVASLVVAAREPSGASRGSRLLVAGIPVFVLATAYLAVSVVQQELAEEVNSLIVGLLPRFLFSALLGAFVLARMDRGRGTAACQ